MKLKFLATAVAFFISVFLYGCGGGSSGGSGVTTPEEKDPPTLTSITVAPESATIQTGSTRQFTATGTYSDGSTENLTSLVTWDSTDKAVATIDDDGLATGTGEGTATISAAYDGKSGSATLTVEDVVTPPTLESITIAPESATIYIDESLQFTATANYSDGTSVGISATTVIWTSGDETVATIDENGFATGAAEGSTIITASFGDKSDSADLTVEEKVTPPELESISIAPTVATILPGSTKEFYATAHYTNGSSVTLEHSSVTWTSSNEDVASIVDGLATGSTVGETTISATFNGETGIATLHVSSLESITIQPDKPSIEVCEQIALTVKGHFSNGLDDDVTSEVDLWTSSNESVATIDSNGVVHGKCLPEGTEAAHSRITATLGSLPKAYTSVSVCRKGVVVLDNGAPNTEWLHNDTLTFWGTESLTNKTGATYTWEFTSEVSGEYDIKLWWSQHANRSDAVQVEILYEGAVIDSAVIDQTTNGGQWNHISQVSLAAGDTCSVKITGPAGTRSTCADAVMFALPMFVVDNDAPGTSSTGSWSSSSGSNPHGGSSLSARPEATYTWSFDGQPAGYYEVSLWWTVTDNRASNVAVDIATASGNERVYINQTADGGRWNVLPGGPYYFDTAGSVTIHASSELYGDDFVTTCADAVRFRFVSE